MRLTWTTAGAAAIVLIFFTSLLRPHIHHDVWHQMALAREVFALGRVPAADSFAYTPTVAPVVHHEWGAGIVAFLAYTRAGPLGLGLLNLALAAAVCALALRHYARRGWLNSSGAATALCCVWLVNYSFLWPITAQAYSVLAAAVLLMCLETDARGSRRWIAPWLAVWVLWVNLHGGISAGLVILGAWATERALRREPWLHIAGVMAACATLTLATPFGLDYPRFLLRALGMSRPHIPEWRPDWLIRETSFQSLAYFASLPLLALTLRRFKEVRGIFVLLLLALAAARVRKLLPFYGLALLWLAPPLVRLPLPPLAACTASVIALILLGAFRPWSPRMDHLPVGAVEYLSRTNFTGNVLTFFRHGPYVSWRLWPKVKVSCDSRYEAAYPVEAVESNFALYLERPAAIDERLPVGTGLILVDHASPLGRYLRARPAVYSDERFALYRPRAGNLKLSAPVAQPDRASGFEPAGRGFESLRARHSDAIPKPFHPEAPAPPCVADRGGALRAGALVDGCRPLRASAGDGRAHPAARRVVAQEDEIREALSMAAARAHLAAPPARGDRRRGRALLFALRL